LLRIEAVLGNKRLIAGDAMIVPRIANWMRFDGDGP
jgi:hypothetical protein